MFKNDSHLQTPTLFNHTQLSLIKPLVIIITYINYFDDKKKKKQA